MNGELRLEGEKLVWYPKNDTVSDENYLNNNTIRVIDPDDAEKAVLSVTGGMNNVFVALCEELRKIPRKVQLMFGYNAWVALYNWIRYKFEIEFTGKTKCGNLDDLAKLFIPEVDQSGLDKHQLAEFMQFPLSFLNDIRSNGINAFCNSLVEANSNYNVSAFLTLLEKIKDFDSDQIESVGSVVSPSGYFCSTEMLALDITDVNDGKGIFI